MAFHTETSLTGDAGAHCLEFGALDPEELSVFATLIDQRRPLPIFLGDAWRCDACLYECADIAQMAEHIIATHEPEPMNNEDWEEMLREDRQAERGL